MSKIEELLKNEKVEWKRLGEIANITGAGVDKKKVEGEKYIKLLNYMDVYKNQYINPNIPTMLVTAPDNKIKNCNIEYGDVFVTPSSETTDDIFRSAVAVENMKGIVYSYHIMRVRLNNKNFITSCYLNFIFESESFRHELFKHVNGNTRKTIAKSEVEKLLVPIPTLETQEKIVKTLDKFTKYVAELQTELQFRLKQYEYYRDMLLSENSLNEISAKLESQLIHGIHKIQFSKDEKNECVGIENYIIWCKIADVCLRQRGIPITAEKMKELHKDNAPVRIFAGGNTFADISMEDIDEKNIINTPSVVVKSRGNIDFEFYDRQFSHKNEMWSYSSLDSNILNIKFMYYYLKNNVQYFRDNAISGKLPQISTGTTDNYKIPIPNIEIQNHIVTILDKFQDILSDTKGMLPKEIELRQKQYEYYREKLLTFDVDYGRERERESL